jgi:hypothetical protein
VASDSDCQHHLVSSVFLSGHIDGRQRGVSHDRDGKIRCRCKHKSHRGVCLRKTLRGYPPSFDNVKDICTWCYTGIHEDQKRPMVKASEEW